MTVLLDLRPIELAEVVHSNRRTLVCRNSQGEHKVFFPEASSKKFINSGTKVLISPYKIATPKHCTHYLVSSYLSIFHKSLGSNYNIQPMWVGVTSLYNNRILKALFDLQLWIEPVFNYQSQVMLNDSRIDFCINSRSKYIEVKSQDLSWWGNWNPRLKKHLQTLNQTKGSVVAFIAPYPKQFSLLYNKEKFWQKAVLSSYMNIQYVWIFVEYTPLGLIVLKQIDWWSK